MNPRDQWLCDRFGAIMAGAMATFAPEVVRQQQAGWTRADIEAWLNPYMASLERSTACHCDDPGRAVAVVRNAHAAVCAVLFNDWGSN